MSSSPFIVMAISRIFDVGQSVTTQPDERGLSDSIQPWLGSWHQTTLFIYLGGIIVFLYHFCYLKVLLYKYSKHKSRFR
jgi:hypothetical protein